MNQAQKKKKQVEYRAKLKEVRSWADSLGEKVDSGVEKAVTLLNLLGYHTLLSCEGHLSPEFATLTPWVNVEAKNKTQGANIRRLVRSYWQYRLPTRKGDLTSIFIYDDIKNVVRIQVGPDYFWDLGKEKPKMPLSVRKWLWTEGQNEFKIFTKYLWKLYMGEEKLLKNPPHGR